MRVQNTTKDYIDAGEFLFAPGQEIDVIPKVAAELAKVKGLEMVKEKKPAEKPVKKAKK